MTAAPLEPPAVPPAPESGWDLLLHTWQGLDVPEGWRAEIIGGQITVVPPPPQGHNIVASLIHRTLARGLPDDLMVFQTLGLHVAPEDSLCIPDIVVVPRPVLDAASTGPVPADEALLVVEITSRANAETDRTTKKRYYAAAPVPLYLVVDRWHRGGPVVTLYAEPNDGEYQQITRVPFGAKLVLPDPFGITVDTGEFPAP